ncbi:MAG: YbjN domain-containing protein, partial [Aggregatilineales bacterium]
MSTTIYEEMKRFFENDQWAYQELPERPGISLRYAGQNGSFDCFAYAREDQSQFVFYAVCGIKAPEMRRLSVAEFIGRANYGMIIGNFEMDFGNGEVRYKCAVDIEG